jgi:choice-of-anchor B domain-containing protein
VRLSSTGYATASYTHSGWPSTDGRFLFVHDELDEIRRGINTQIYTLDLADLRAPRIVTSYTGANTTTDHNGYVKGTRLYVSHYRRGVVVFDAAAPESLRELGYFDTFLAPAADAAGTDGAWGVYPFFPSGTIAVSDIDNGLFLLRDRIVAPAPSVGRLGFADAAPTISEANANVSVRVRRTGGSLGATSVRVTTRDDA